MPMRAVHPGAILKAELDGLGVTPTAFARQIGVPPNRISRIIAGKRAVTGDTALRLGHWFGSEPQFWLNLQSAHDIRIAAEKAGRAIVKLPLRAGVRRSDGQALRAIVDRAVAGEPPPTGGILAALRRSPLVGAGLDLGRQREGGTREKSRDKKREAPDA